MKNRNVWIGVGVVAVILVILLVIFILRSTPQNSVTAEPLLFVTPTLSVDLTTSPTVIASVTVVPEPTAFQVKAGSIWKVVSIEDNAIQKNGYKYDVATFASVDQPTFTMKAQCMAPGWPSPEIGQKYVLNDYNILYPIEGNDSHLQRFLKLSQ